MRGSVLIVALWTLEFMAFLAVVMSLHAGFRIQAAARLTRRISSHQAAWGAAEEAIASLLKQKEKGEGFTSGEGFTLVEENGKISLNAAPAGTLSALLAQFTDPSNAEEIAAAAVDWREKNGSLESVEELLLVEGMDSDLFFLVRDSVTVFGNGKVNLNAAGPAILKGMGFSSSLANKLLLYRKGPGPDESFGTPDDGRFSSVGTFPAELNQGQPLSKEELAEASALAGSGLFTAESDLFELNVRKGNPGEPGFRAFRFLVNLEGAIQQWREE